LHDEHVRATDRLVETTVDLAVGELAQIGFGERDAELLGDVHREGRMTAPRHHHEAPFGECLHGASVQG